MRNDSPSKAQKKENVAPDALPAAAVAYQRLMPYVREATRLTVECPRRDYSARGIAHAVEECDAHVLNLNLTADNPGNGSVVVDLRVDRVNVTAIIRSLERYGFHVTSLDRPLTEEDDDDTGYRQSVEQFLRYLEI